MITVLSVDHDCSPQIAGMIGASAALVISEIPFDGPVGTVEVGLVDGEYIINPTSEQSAESQMSLIVAGTGEAVLMVEASADEVSEKTVLDAIVFGHETVKSLVALQNEMREQVGKPKRCPELFRPDETIEARVESLLGDRLTRAVRTKEKMAREEALETLESEIRETLKQDYPESTNDIAYVFHRALRQEVRRSILEDGTRPDGRKADEIRPIWCEVGTLPRTHGSGVFTRGQTQVLSVTTLGASGDIQELDTIDEEEFKRYIHHYNFPPFSVGETRPLRGPGRREIGHGALAERALLKVLPDEAEFRTRFVWSPKCWNPTAHLRWRASAAAPYP